MSSNQISLTLTTNQGPEQESRIWKKLGVSIKSEIQEPIEKKKVFKTSKSSRDSELEKLKQKYRDFKILESEKRKMESDRLKKRLVELEEVIKKRNTELKEKNIKINELYVLKKMEKITIKKEYEEEIRSVKKNMVKFSSNTVDEDSDDDEYFSCDEEEPEDFFEKIDVMWEKTEKNPRVKVDIQTNWIETFLDLNSELITGIYVNHNNVNVINKMKIDSMEEKIEELTGEMKNREARWKKKETEYNKELDNLKLRLRDAEFLRSLI